MTRRRRSDRRDDDSRTGPSDRIRARRADDPGYRQPAAELPSEVTIPVSAVDDFERDLQNVADDLDDWSIKLHDQFRELCMTVMKFAGFLDYEVTVRKRTAE